VRMPRHFTDFFATFATSRRETELTNTEFNKKPRKRRTRMIRSQVSRPSYFPRA